MGRLWLLGLVATSTLMAACLDLRIKDGDSFPCSASGSCPSPYTCYSGQCRRTPPSTSDGGVDLASSDDARPETAVDRSGGDDARPDVGGADAPADTRSTCTAGDPACGNYACDSGTSTCKTSCSTKSDCAATAYCNGTTCAPIKPAGEVCTRGEECTSGSCGGRCCTAGTTCTCPQPSAGNLIKNPGFDRDISGWTVDAGDGTVVFAAQEDAAGCPFSGSAFIALTGAVSPRISQCVPLSKTVTYNYGFQVRSSSGGSVHCGLDLFADPACITGFTRFDDFEWLNVNWSPNNSGSFQPSTVNAGSARIWCTVSDGTEGLYVDTVFVTPAPGMY